MSENSTKTTDRFVRELSIMDRAGVGVIMLRTREPFRASSAICEYAHAKEKPFHSWSSTVGWSTIQHGQSPDDATPDRNTAMPGSLFRVNGVAGQEAMEDGFFCMQWPQHFVKTPAIVTCLAEYTAVLPATEKRLILVMPMSYTLPKELESMIPIIDLDVPDREELAEGYQWLVERIPDDRRPELSEEDVGRIVTSGQGMTMNEWETALARTFTKVRDSLPSLDVDKFCEEVSGLKVEVVKRSETLELLPSVPMSEVGGLQPLKDWVKARSYAFSEEAREMGVDRPRGIALIGSPGSGKSLVGKAVASSLTLPLVRFDVSRCFHGIVGSSEERVRESLKIIDALSPCVVHLDEVDKAFDMNSGGGDSGVGKRVLGAILTHLQESKEANFWVLTANRVDGLPSELLRKGRLDEVWSVGLPNEKERLEVLTIHVEKRGYSVQEIDDTDAVIEASAGYTAAEIEGAVKEAVLNNYVAWKEGGENDEPEPLTASMLKEAFSGMKPMSIAFAEQFQQMEEWAANNARAAGEARPQQRRRSRAGGSPVSRGRRVDVAGGDDSAFDG